MGSSAYRDLGGETVLRSIIHAFVDRVYADPMIGFFFEGVDRDRLKQREFEFTARFLGADLPYSGRSLESAHTPYKIFEGHFDRRRQILLDTLRHYQVPPTIEALWMAHVDGLRGRILRGHAECNAPPSEMSSQDPADGRTRSTESTGS